MVVSKRGRLSLLPLFVLVCALAACANRPESIAASYVSHEKFMDLDCPALDAALGDTRSELDKFSRMQDSKANSDAVGVFLLGVPFSKLAGDHEATVARLKGEIEAIETAQIKRRCRASSGTVVLAQPAAPASAAASAADVERQVALLDDLRAKGLLGDAEYQARRTQILEDALARARTAAPVAAAPAAAPAVPPPAPAAVAPTGLQRGDRLVFSEVDSLSGVQTAQTVLTLDDLSEGRLSFNGGTVVLRRDGRPENGQLAASYIHGFSPQPRDAVARFHVPNNPTDVELRLAYIGTQPRQIAGRTFNVLRYRVSGHAAYETRPAAGQAGKGGSPITGELVVDAATGLVLEHRTECAHPSYDVNRRLVGLTR